MAFTDIGIYVARVPFANPTTPENLRATTPILPVEPLDAICYSYAAASVVIGDSEGAAVIEVRGGKPVITSDQARAWSLMRYAGLFHKPEGYLKLFDDDLSGQIRN